MSLLGFKSLWIAVICIPLVVGCATVREYGCDEILSVTTEESERSESHYRKGVRLVDKGKLPAAAEAFEKAIQSNFENGSAHNNLGLVHYQMRRLPEAVTEFTLATQYLPDDPIPWNNLGMAMEAIGNGSQAIEYYARAHELAPRKALYLGNLVRTRIRMGESDDSVVDELKELLTIESRTDWIEWINDQLTLRFNPMFDRGPPPPNFNALKRPASSNNAKPSMGYPSVVPLAPQQGELILAEPLPK